ncbi:MAG: PAS domain S-box protein [Deltaproteobacteria bacterium]|nr:PAS domain S-box protein [Deltaproteobacteria bacterium]
MSPMRLPFVSRTKYEKQYQEIERLDARYGILANNIAAAVLIFDEEGKLCFVSPYTEAITGYDTTYIKQTQGDFLELVIIEEYLEKYKRAKKVALVGEDMLVRYQILHKDGFRLWLETRFVPIMTEDSDRPGLISLSMDLTDSMNYQQLIEQQNQDLGDFAYMVSHDLKAPIFTIKGMLSSIKTEYSNALGEAGNEYVQYIEDATERLSNLIASVVEYSKITSTQLEPIDVSLAELMQVIKSDLNELITQSDAAIEIAPQLPIIHAPRIWLYQIFSNLIGNAIKYRDKNKNLYITIFCTKQDKEQVVIAVKDNGLGIPQTKIQDVFRPFKRAHSNDVSGSGIGLTCVKKLAQKLSGSVGVESEEGVGSSFWVSFPQKIIVKHHAA